MLGVLWQYVILRHKMHLAKTRGFKTITVSEHDYYPKTLALIKADGFKTICCGLCFEYRQISVTKNEEE